MKTRTGTESGAHGSTEVVTDPEVGDIWLIDRSQDGFAITAIDESTIHGFLLTGRRETKAEIELDRLVRRIGTLEKSRILVERNWALDDFLKNQQPEPIPMVEAYRMSCRLGTSSPGTIAFCLDAVAVFMSVQRRDRHSRVPGILRRLPQPA